ncbi:MAG: lipopolysaccharide biosynthesis protein, partial [Planctomycetota bacterium]
AGAIRAGRPEDLVGWIGAFLRLSLALAAVAFLVGLVVLPLGSRLALDVDGERIGRLAVALALVPLLDVPRIVCSAALQGERRMLPLARIDTGQEVCRLVLVVAGALLVGGAEGPVGGMILASVCGSLIALDSYRRQRRAPDSVLPGLVQAFRTRTVPARRALREGIQVGFVRNVDSLGVQTLPTLILGSLGNRDWVAYLRIAQRMVAVARLVMQGINRTALPVLSQLAGVKDIAGLRRTYWKASLLSGATITGGLALMLPVMPWLIDRLFPREFGEPVWTIILILAPGLAIVSFSVANDVFYIVTQQMRVAILLSLAGLVVNTAQVALFAWWLPTVGVAIGLTVTCLWSLVHVGYAWSWFRRHPDLVT